jgi:hypothetical protein
MAFANKLIGIAFAIPFFMVKLTKIKSTANYMYKNNICQYLDQLTWEFVQLCQRDNGTIYGIASGKQCRKGKPISYNPNDKKLGVKPGLKQIKVTNKDKVKNIVAKAKAIGLTNKEIRSIKEEVKVELNKKKVQGTEALKLFAKKANALAKSKKKDVKNSTNKDSKKLPGKDKEVKKPSSKGKEVGKPKTKEKDFPDDLELNNLQFVKNLGGSTGAQLVRDPKTGKEYVRKTGSSPDHIREEFYAEEAYRALGVPIPKSKLYDDGTNPVKLSEYLPNAKSLRSLAGKEKEDAIAKIKEGFAVDALMGNWDSVGMSGDNILVDSNGKPWRIDVGGSLRFRAQGAAKQGDQWNEYPTELWSMKESSQGKGVYGDLNIRQISDQIRKLDQSSINKALNSLPEPLKSTMGRRIEEAQRIAKIQDTLTKDEFKDDYVDEFTRQSLQLRNTGLIDKLSTSFTQDKKPYYLVDEKGESFDNLRGTSGSLEKEWEKYVSDIGGATDILEVFLDSQSGDSWDEFAVGLKYWFANQQNVPLSSYYWRDPYKGASGQAGIDFAKKNLENYTKYHDQNTINKTFAAFHAFTYEQLQRYDMPNNYRDRSTIGVIRTVDNVVLQGKSIGDSGLQLNQGIIESYSMFSTYYYNGSEVIVQEIPHHRALGMYMQQSPNAIDEKGLLAGDHENEILVMQRGIPATYIGDWGTHPSGTEVDVEKVI